jgi:Flp pilus assembly protein TadG
MPALRNRRGSVLVMVALMLVSLMAVTAIAADIGRFYVVTGELQTAADAAALKGAGTLQVIGTIDPEPTVDAAVVGFVAATNKADNGTLSVTADKVQLGYWTPGGTSADLVLNGRRPNAVVVTVAGAPKGVFSQLIGRVTGLGMERQATAWIANLGSNCVRPWAFPYLPLYRAVSGNAAAANPAPELDPAKFLAFEQSDSSQRAFTMLGANQVSTKANDGNWLGFNFTGNAGKPGFVDGIEGCRNYPVSTDAGNGVTLPGQANQYVTWSTQAITGTGPGNSGPAICALKNKDAGCYATSSATQPGVMINVAWGDAIGTGSNTVDFRYVGEFKLKCYFTGPTDVCSYPVAGTTGYPEGTLIGFMGGLKSRIITPEDVFGNTPSNVQRIILVK